MSTQETELKYGKVRVNLRLFIGIFVVLGAGILAIFLLAPKEVPDSWPGMYWAVALPEDGTIPKIEDIGAGAADSRVCMIMAGSMPGECSIMLGSMISPVSGEIICNDHGFKSKPVPGDEAITGKYLGGGIILVDVTDKKKKVVRYAMRKASDFEFIEWGRHAVMP